MIGRRKSRLCSSAVDSLSFPMLRRRVRPSEGVGVITTPRVGSRLSADTILMVAQRINLWSPSRALSGARTHPRSSPGGRYFCYAPSVGIRDARNGIGEDRVVCRMTLPSCDNSVLCDLRLGAIGRCSAVSVRIARQDNAGASGPAPAAPVTLPPETGASAIYERSRAAIASSPPLTACV